MYRRKEAQVSTVDARIMKHMSKTFDMDANMCFSPYSLKMVLVSLLFGLNKSTFEYKQLMNLMGIPSTIDESDHFPYMPPYFGAF